jgi:hypothetical protein
VHTARADTMQLFQIVSVTDVIHTHIDKKRLFYDQIEAYANPFIGVATFCIVGRYRQVHFGPAAAFLPIPAFYGVLLPP